LRYLSELTNKVKEKTHVWIQLSDGTRLSAHLWLPADAQGPVPAILEYIPYRHGDMTAKRDSMMHGYFAAHGYACVRVDLRGSGNSEGVLTDEYLQQELDDGIEVIHWIAEQAWCDGSVGMIGISWGGFNGLQIAAHQPEPLKAVVSVCSSDDRYAEDVHYMGGCLLGDNLSWASVMFAFNSCPPDPETVGDAWRDMWMQRLEKSGHWLTEWLEHQHRDEYWRHGSICEDFAAVKTPVLAASGWADGYTNTVFRLMEHLSCPRMGLVGPWSHKYPHVGLPGPAIGFLQECLRWWGRWLEGEPTGIMDEPMLRVYMQDSVSPFTSYQCRPGKWVAEDEWPSPNIEYRSFTLAPGYALVPTQPESQETPAQEVALPDESPLSVGLFAGKWCSYSYAPDLPGDQREEDGGSLILESDVLEQDLEILGRPEIQVELESSEPSAMICARLSDIAPNREATRITYGVINMTHRNSHAEPEPMEPGKRYRVTLQLNNTGHIFRKGHRFRIAVSTSYWPLAWAPPKPVRLTLYTGSSVLYLPVRQAHSLDNQVSFQPPEAFPSVKTSQLQPTEHNWRVVRDLASNESALEVINDHGTVRLDDIDWTVTRDARERYSYVGDDFESLRGEVKATRRFQRGAWSVHTNMRTLLTCTAEHFHLHAELDAYEGDRRVFCNSWNQHIPRRLV